MSRAWSGRAYPWLDHVFTARGFVRVLGAQYVAGGLVVLAWAQLPWNQAASWYPAVVSLGVLGAVLGTAMVAVSALRLGPRAANQLAHLCIFSAEVVVAVGWAATEDHRTPLPLLLLWATAYAGVLSARARWAHVVVMALLLAVAASTMPRPAHALGDLILVVSTIAVVTLVVSRTVGRLHRLATLDPLTALRTAAPSLPPRPPR